MYHFVYFLVPRVLFGGCRTSCRRGRSLDELQQTVDSVQIGRLVSLGPSSARQTYLKLESNFSKRRRRRLSINKPFPLPFSVRLALCISSLNLNICH